MTSLLDFYQQHHISPVAQEIGDLPAHFARRARLYGPLGLTPVAVRGKWVMEVGPGTGENALYTRSLKPARYVLVEPNPAAADALLARLPEAELWQEPIETVEAGLFDYVICEGLLGLCGSDPKVLLEHVAKHVVVGGVLVITCIDAISDHAEVLRRAMAQKILTERGLRSAPIAEQLDVLRPVFAPHLATLKGMTRSVDDWIVDNLLNPASIGSTFSVPEALEQLNGRFEVMGCSPSGLLPDWRWYKEAESGNQWAVEAYWLQAHNLYDKRSVTTVNEPAWNYKSMRDCLKTRALLRAYESGEELLCPDKHVGPDWFGRGQQYLSFVRTA